MTWAYCIDYTQLEIGAPGDPVEPPPWMRYQMKLYAMLCLNYPEDEIEKMWQLGLTMWPHLCEWARWGCENCRNAGKTD